MKRMKLYIQPGSSNLGATFVYAFWAESDMVYPTGLARLPIAVKVGDFEIPWPEGMTLVQALEAWKHDGCAA